MLESGMKLKIEDILKKERKGIAGGFQLRHTPLVASDINSHKCQMEEVYWGMLREADVVDKCCRRFESMFGRN